MEFHELAICPECDQRYPIHRLWCDHCGEGLTRRAKALTDSEAHLLRQKLNTAMELYGQVLQDLEDLSGTDRMEPWLHDKIRSFYGSRLRQTKAGKRGSSGKWGGGNVVRRFPDPKSGSPFACQYSRLQ